jgi:predicted nucleotidyltransferase
MNIHKLLSSKERVKILKSILYKTGPLSVNKTAKELSLSKALISQFFTTLRKEGILNKKNEIKSSVKTKSLKILLNLSEIDIKIFDKPFIISAGLYGSFIKGENTDDSDIDVWILTEKAKEEQLANLTNELNKEYKNIRPLYLTRDKLSALKDKDKLFYHSLVFGSITIYGDKLEEIQ